MQKFLLSLFRLYFKHFPIRKGKIPVLFLIDKLGITKNYTTITKFDKGELIKVNLDDWIQKQVFFFGRYEIEKKETFFWQNFIQEGQHVFDIGANVGYYSLQASVRTGKDGKVYAFEPVSKTYNKLCENINLNSIKNIIPVKLALSNSKGEIELYVADEKSTGSSSITMHVSFSGIKEKAKTNSLDDYIKENNISRIDVVKIDVEGSEPMVIHGMKEIMKSLKPIILIEVLDERLKTVGSSKEQLYNIFKTYRYQPYKIIDANTIKYINKPIEESLVIFKHEDVPFPEYIKLLS